MGLEIPVVLPDYSPLGRTKAAQAPLREMCEFVVDCPHFTSVGICSITTLWLLRCS